LNDTTGVIKQEEGDTTLVDERYVFISFILALLTVKKNTQCSYRKAGTSSKAGEKYFGISCTSLDKACPGEKYVYKAYHTYHPSFP